MAKRSEARKALRKEGYSDRQIDYMWGYLKLKKHATICRIDGGIERINATAALTLPREFEKYGGVLSEENIKRWEFMQGIADKELK